MHVPQSEMPPDDMVVIVVYGAHFCGLALLRDSLRAGMMALARHGIVVGALLFLPRHARLLRSEGGECSLRFFARINSARKKLNFSLDTAGAELYTFVNCNIYVADIDVRIEKGE